MARKPKTERVPRTRAGGEWTEAQFWNFLTSALRKASRRWPPIVRQVWQRYRRENQSDNKRLKWEFWCAGCGEWFPAKELQVEHTEQITKQHEFLPWVQRQECDPETIQQLIKMMDEVPEAVSQWMKPRNFGTPEAMFTDRHIIISGRKA